MENTLGEFIHLHLFSICHVCGAVCMFVCMYVLPVCGHICARVCVGLRLMSGINIIHSSTLFIEAGSLSQTQSLLIWLVVLLCLLWGFPVPPFQTGIAMQIGHSIYVGFYGAKLLSSCLYLGVLTAESSPHPSN